MENCIFCDIVRGKADAAFVYQDGRVCAFMDHQPVNPGHVLVIPREHAAHLADLPPETGAHLFRIAQRIAGALRSSGIRCEGVNLFLADGEAAMQEVMHVHLHVLPRFRGDGFGLHFSADYFTRPRRSSLEESAAAIRGQLGADPTAASPISG